ncbi:hypothetical protein CDD83_5315 [Cordyceps sp. RAO-2017]|nr:hypothetical protein CDD83_5315 [Cordyceps sp. RAO-2017]
MKFLTVASLLFAGALAVPVDHNAGYDSPGGSVYGSPSGSGYGSPSGSGYNSPGRSGYNSPGRSGYYSPGRSGYNSPGRSGYSNGGVFGGGVTPGNGGAPGNGGKSLCAAGLYSSPQCCSTDVLGVAGLDCKAPSSGPTDLAGFKGICGAAGKSARCCVLPVAGQDVLCTDPLPA